MTRLVAGLLDSPFGLMFLGLLLFLFGGFVNYRAWPGFRLDGGLIMLAGLGVLVAGWLWFRQYRARHWK